MPHKEDFGETHEFGLNETKTSSRKNERENYLILLLYLRLIRV